MNFLPKKEPKLRILASSLVGFLALGVFALAGSLTPPGAPGSTMNTLAEIYDTIAGAFDSTGVVADQNGSLIEHLKYIEDNMPSLGVSSDSLDFDEFVDSMTLDADTNIASAGFVLTTEADVGIGTTNPRDKLEIAGFLRTASASAELLGGSPTGMYSNAVEFQGKLYVAGTQGGHAIVYVYNGQTWTVSRDFGAASENIVTMAVYAGKLYAGVGNPNSSSIWAYDGTTWAISFGPSSIDDFRGMTAYNGKLYVGAGYDWFDVSILEFDGTTWSTTASFFGTSYGAFSMAVFNGKLYMGTAFEPGVAAKIRVFDGVSVRNGDFIFPAGYSNVQALVVYNGVLYAGLGGGASGGDVWAFKNGVWSLVKDFGATVTSVYGMAAYDDRLYVATGDSKLYSFDGTTWTVVLTGGASVIYGNPAVVEGKLFAQHISDGVYVLHSTLESQLAKDFRPSFAEVGEGPLHVTGTLTAMGNLGIASSSPFTKFALVGSAGNYDLLNIASSSGTSVLRIKKSGNIGINKAAPTTTLDVNGSVSISGNFELTGFMASNLTPRTTDTFDLGTSTLRWRDLYLASGSLHIGVSGDEAVIDYDVASDYLAFKPDGSTTKMALTDAGLLELNGTASLSNALFVANGGNVGIGDLYGGFVGNPGAALHVVSNGGSSPPAAAFILEGRSSTGVGTDDNTLMNFVHSNGANGRTWTIGGGSSTFFGVPDNFGIRQVSTNTTALVIDTSNKIAIGDIPTSIATMLEVRGTASFDPFQVASGSGTSFLRVTKAGRVGIGTTTPNDTLDVSGAIEFNIASSSGASDSFALCHNVNGNSSNQELLDCGNAPIADYMEMYPMADSVQEGDIVMPSDRQIQTTNGQGTVPEMVQANDRNRAMGIVSVAAHAGDFNSIGYNIPQWARPMPLALVGRVNVRISMENGPISAGDPIALSSTPGVGAKAVTSGFIVGRALEPISSAGTVLVFVNPTYWAPGISSVTGSTPLDNAGSGWLSWDFSELFSAIVARFSSILGIEFGEGSVKADRLCAGSVCVNEQQLQQLLDAAPPSPKATEGTAPLEETPEPTPTETPESTPEPQQSAEPSPETTPEPEAPIVGEPLE